MLNRVMALRHFTNPRKKILKLNVDKTFQVAYYYVLKKKVWKITLGNNSKMMLHCSSIRSINLLSRVAKWLTFLWARDYTLVG
jgi:hypothetical protein